MSETSQHKLYWLPNALTVGRILLIPVLVTCMVAAGIGTKAGIDAKMLWMIAFVIFAICMATDYLDGYLARSWEVTSEFGRMLDPIADKLLVAAALISIAIVHQGVWIILVPALVIIGRDITVSGVREYAALSRKVMPPTKLAKWKTAAEMLAILLFILAYIFGSMFPENSGWVLYPPLDNSINAPHTHILNGFLFFLWLAAVLSAYTGFRYFRAALVKTEVIDGPLDVKPFTNLKDEES